MPRGAPDAAIRAAARSPYAASRIGRGAKRRPRPDCGHRHGTGGAAAEQTRRRRPQRTSHIVDNPYLDGKVIRLDVAMRTGAK